MYCFQMNGQEVLVFFGFLVYITVTSGTAQVAMVLNADGTEGLRWVGGEYQTYDIAAVDEAEAMVVDVLTSVYAEQGLTYQTVDRIRRTTPDVDYLIQL